MSDKLFKFPGEALGTPVVGHPAEDRRVEGNPAQSSWEFCHILSGVSVIEEVGAEPVTLKAGDTFIMRPGFVGLWRVIETTRKLYVIKAR